MGEPPIAQYSYQTIQGSECYNDTFKNLISKEPIWIEVKRMLKGAGGHSLDLHPDSTALYAEFFWSFGNASYSILPYICKCICEDTHTYRYMVIAVCSLHLDKEQKCNIIVKQLWHNRAQPSSAVTGGKAQNMFCRGRSYETSGYNCPDFCTYIPRLWVQQVPDTPGGGIV